jgi:putative transposase
MPRIARVVAQNVPHHVTQRGNGRQPVFRRADDYLLYIDLLRHYSTRYHLSVWAYCLMPNHVHLISVPAESRSLAGALGRTHAEYARHFNIVGRSCGHVWQARYFSCPMDDVHCWRAMAYVEQNPVRAGLVSDAPAYLWSSARAHVGRAIEPMLDLQLWAGRYTARRWADVLKTSVADEALAERIRQATLRGRPLGNDTFVHSIEVSTGRRLRPKAPGRPRKQLAVAASASAPLH